MGYTIHMQDWVTARASSSSAVVLQPESDYLDISMFKDFAAYIEIAEFVSGVGVNVKLQTAPVKEEVYFQDLVTVTPSAAGIATPIPVVRYSTGGGAVAPARWLRWRCGATMPDWGITFRININCNPSD
jgi:hypothetical protein